MLVLFYFTSFNLQAQLCQGSFGDPLVNITFGSGTNPGAPLSAATTNYQYVSNDCPNDGFYTVRNNTTNCFGNSWFSLTSDHTGNTNGYFMLVNASIQPSAFYVDTVRGLCANSTYEFAAWIINMSILQPTGCGGNPIQPNITFSIEKTDGTVLQTSNSNNIPPTTTAIWNRFGLVFTTPAGVSDIVLRMTNNATGGCGNDIALDDITFRPCGPQLTPSIVGNNTTSAIVCEGTPQTFNINCTVSAGFNSPTYQWQQSFNGNAFTDMIGENNISLQVNFSPTSLVGIYRYRLAVAEAGNLNSAPCRIASQPITINVKARPLVSASNNGPICASNNILLTVTGATTYQWTGPNGFTANGSPISINNAQPINAGNYIVLGKDAAGCENTNTTNVVINPSPTVVTAFSDSSICAKNQVQLLANGLGSFQWSPAGTLSNANSANPIATPLDSTNYMVVLTNGFNCTDTAYTLIKVIKKPIVDAGPDKIIVANKTVQLNGNIVGTVSSYSWTPTSYMLNANTLSPTINPPADTKYYLTAIATNNCGTVIDSVFVKIYQGIFIPNVFTPNGDSKNDTWNIPALEAYPLHELAVYNRYGEIVFERKQQFNAWDGRYKSQDQPSGVYTYVIDLKNGTAILKGTVLILR